MKIDSSIVGMESARSYQATWKTSKRFMITDYQKNQGDREQGLDLKEDEEERQEDKVVSLSEHQNSMSIGRARIRSQNRESTADSIRQMTVRYIFQLLFAQRRGRLKEFVEEQNQKFGQPNGALSINLTGGNTQQLAMVQEGYFEEEEQTEFSTTGHVVTSDGRTIDFGIQVSMSSSFREYYREELAMSAVKLCDPIVLNFDTDVATLSDQTFFFDLDADGEKDEISGLNAGSGFLALDKNGNGVIDDGSELFGTESQNGFADLAKYDLDHNGWIDENDEVFDKLKIWCKDENGKDVLYRLKDKGVGAICLQNVSTEFGLKDDRGGLMGQIRRSGVFLYENGNVGTIQHVDLAKYEKNA